MKKIIHKYRCWICQKPSPLPKGSVGKEQPNALASIRYLHEFDCPHCKKEFGDKYRGKTIAALADH